MSKLVLEISSNKEPKQDDILVYNSVLNLWEYKSKAEYLKSCHKDYLECQKEIKELKKICNQALSDVQTMAKIMKEGMK